MIETNNMLKWKTKKGNRVLEEANVICRVLPDGEYVIKSPEGHWSHDIAENAEEAIKVCEAYVRGHLEQKQAVETARAYYKRMELTV
jgi:hypothetical protein